MANKKNGRAAVADLIRELGGPSKIAEGFKIQPSAVSNWKRLGRFPSHTFVKLSGQLKRRGLDAPPVLWGMMRR
jgi:hypothetical protein